MFAPVKTLKAVVDRLSREINAVLNDSAAAKRNAN
jgi:outer membrane murein-binding lipoprotein Lpp